MKKKSILMIIMGLALMGMVLTAEVLNGLTVLSFIVFVACALGLHYQAKEGEEGRLW